MSLTPPPSPCINVCVLGGDGLCIGCLRTADEIGRWRDMSAQDQWDLLAQLEERHRRRQAAAPSSGGALPAGEDE